MLDGVQWPSSGGSEITTRYMRARAHTTRVLCFLLSQVSHKLYNPLCNNYLHWFQKQHPSMSHFHSTTPPQKLPKTPSSKQLFDLQSKTTRHFPQNDTSFLGWWSIFDSIRCDTCDSKKSKLLGRERVYARVRTYSPSTANTDPSPPSQSSKTNTHLRYLHTHFTKQR